MVPIIKVISGGQVGADIAALRVAKRLGLETGGWMPQGWHTLAGSKPEYAELYGMKEYGEPGYRKRTFANVLDSDGTLRFATSFVTPGEKCTLQALKVYMKPHFDIDLARWVPVEEVREWLRGQQIKVLNVAGNAFRSIEPDVELYMEAILGDRKSGGAMRLLEDEGVGRV